MLTLSNGVRTKCIASDESDGIYLCECTESMTFVTVIVIVAPYRLLRVPRMQSGIAYSYIDKWMWTSVTKIWWKLFAHIAPEGVDTKGTVVARYWLVSSTKDWILLFSHGSDELTTLIKLTFEQLCTVIDEIIQIKQTQDV